MYTDLQHNLSAVRAQVADAALAAGRRVEEITLIGVTKTVDVDRIREALELGLEHLGENRVQEAMPKISELVDYSPKWHLIGSLQTNKVKAILPHVQLIHSLDRWSLAAELQKRAAQLEIKARCLVEVNVAGEESKAGLPLSEVTDFVQTVVAECPDVLVEGLMTVAPLAQNADEVRPYFRQLNALFRHLATDSQGFRMQHLSMGMSNDFSVAIAEGATMVRVGTAIFGRR